MKVERNPARRHGRWLRLGLAAAAIAVPAATQPLLTTTTASAAGGAHVMVIVMEDQGYSGIIGNTAKAPYTNQLVSLYANASSWYGLQHSSLADYVALISGTTGTYSAPTLTGELASAGIAWRAYMEDAPTPCFTGTGAGNYSKVHNPFVHFPSITGNAAQCNNVVPFAGNFANDLNNNTAPPFMFVVPNMCNDMHSGCGSIAKGDSWLSSNLPAAFNSQWCKVGCHIVITWDAGTKTDTTGFNTGNGGHVPTIVISGGAYHKGSFGGGGNQYGILRAIEQIYGVGLLGASASTANGTLPLY